MDLYYSRARLDDAQKSLDPRWEHIFPRTNMFKRFFKLVKSTSTAVQLVESMYVCGMSPSVLETLPEAIVIPLRDAISLCQPYPPENWSKELLGLVSRDDISLLLSPGEKPQSRAASILVGR
jgi:anaphase-promoting complex subunit 1